MVLKFEESKGEGSFQLSDFTCSDQNDKMNTENLFRIVWVLEEPASFIVDTVPVTVEKNQMIFFTPHNLVEVTSTNHKLISFSFNREFYCIEDHDHEVSCHGDLFYGSSRTPIITLCKKDQLSFNRLMEVFHEEFDYKDHIQGQMLQMLLKRMLIKCSRLIKEVMEDPKMPQTSLDLIRQFNVYVQIHFREKHQVQDYADLLFKSPKTLSNLFKKYNDKTPLQVINERLALEGKRLLNYTNKTVEEIAFELGYSDAAHFSKFFKKHAGSSPVTFRNN